MHIMKQFLQWASNIMWNIITAETSKMCKFRSACLHCVSERTRCATAEVQRAGELQEYSQHALSLSQAKLSDQMELQTIVPSMPGAQQQDKSVTRGEYWIGFHWMNGCCTWIWVQQRLTTFLILISKKQVGVQKVSVRGSQHFTSFVSKMTKKVGQVYKLKQVQRNTSFRGVRFWDTVWDEHTVHSNITGHLQCLQAGITPKILCLFPSLV